MNETESQMRLRRAKEALEYARECANSARKQLRDADESARIAKERYEEAFMANEIAEVARLKASYYHSTK